MIPKWDRDSPIHHQFLKVATPFVIGCCRICAEPRASGEEVNLLLSREALDLV
jgi:hypothetical protein